jgi:hypothetical protein
MILFLIFYLTVLAEPELFSRNFSEVFLWVLPFIFSLYVFWDMVKLLEYRNINTHQEDNEIELEINASRFWKTFFFSVLVITQAFIFYFGMTNIFPINREWGFNGTQLFFIIFSTGIILGYRLVKWGIPLRTYGNNVT